jgi:MSP (Major sperm protein) domain
MDRENNILQLTPKAVLNFDVYPNTKTTASRLILKNISNTDLAVKIKASHSKAFYINPNEAFIKVSGTLEVLFSYEFSEDTVNSVHKFLVVAVPYNKNHSDPIDWNYKAQEFKLNARFHIIHENNNLNGNEKDILINDIKILKAKIQKTKVSIIQSTQIDYLTHQKPTVFGKTQLFIFFSSGILISLIFQVILGNLL